MRRYFFNTFEKLVTNDLNSISTKIWKDLHDSYFYNLFNNQSGFIRGAFAPTRSSATGVSLAAGRAFFNLGGQTGDTPNYQSFDADTTVAITHAAAHATLDRYDIVCLVPTLSSATVESRFLKTGGVGPIATEVVTKELRYTYTAVVTQGTNALGPAIPATPAGSLLVYSVFITHAAGIVNQAAITDGRLQFERQLLEDLDANGFKFRTDYLDSRVTTGTLNIGTVLASVVNIGRTGATVNILGSTVNMTVTNANITDANVILNSGGTDTSSVGAGFTVARDSTYGSLIFNATYTSKWACGLLGAESEIVTLAGTQTLTGVKAFTGAVTIGSTASQIQLIVNGSSAAQQSVDLMQINTRHTTATNATSALLIDTSTITSNVSATFALRIKTQAGDALTVNNSGILTGILANADTNIATTVAQTMRHTTSGTAAAGFGVRRECQLQNAAGTTTVAAMWEQVKYTNATAGAEATEWSIWTRTASATLTQNLTVGGDGACAMGPASSAQTLQQAVNGTLAVNSGNAGGTRTYLGACASDYPVISYNGQPTGTTLQFIRKGADVVNVITLGTVVDGAGTAFEFHQAASSTAGSTATLSATTQLTKISTKGAFTFKSTNDASTGTLTKFQPTSATTNFTASTTITLNSVDATTGQGVYDGQVLYFINKTSNALLVKYDGDGVNTGSQIRTKTGADVSIPNYSAFALIYSGVRWLLL